MLEIKSLTHNINQVSLAILALLQGEVDFPYEDWPEDFDHQFEIETSVFYNGRERGICLTVKNYRSEDGKILVVTWGENRNSDSIFVADWIQKNSINPPTLVDMPDKAYDQRQYFTYDAIYPAIYHIRKLIVDFCDKAAKKEVSK